MFEPEAIGERLAKARNEAGLTQEEAGDLADVSTRMVQHYEAGTVTPYRHVRKFAEIYKKPVEWLLHGDEEATDDAALRQAVREEIEPLLEVLRRVEARLEGGEPPPEDGEPA